MIHPHLSSQRLLLLVLASSAFACLPKDTRPIPASLLVTASSDDAVKQGFDTEDGWHIKFTRFVVSMGRSSLDGDACNPYSEAGYVRVLDMQQPGQQKVSIIYGLGHCDFSFRVSNPGNDYLLGPGVSPEDALYMQTAGTDNYTTARGFTGVDASTGINAIINGVATSANEQKTFSWSFRQNLQYAACSVESDAGIEVGLNLQGLASETLNILVRGETLFQTDVTLPGSSLRFQPMALADSQYGNNDGSVSLDELGLVPVHVVAVAGTLGQLDAGNSIGPTNGDAGQRAGSLDAGPASPDASFGDYIGGNDSVFTGDAGITAMNNLEAFVYSVLFPSMFHFRDTGQCAIAIRAPRGR